MSLNKRIYAEIEGDRSIWMIVAALSLISLLVVYSATSALAYDIGDGDTETFLVKHGVILGFGLLLMFLLYIMPYTRFKQAAPYLMLLAVPLLVLTMAVGPEINEARRWLRVPFVGITVQTSDFAKLALILFVAREITRHKDYIKDFNSAFLPIIVPIIIIVGLIAPSDLSTAILLFAVTILMMFMGRVDIKFILLTLLLGVVVFAMLIVMGEFFPEIIRSDTWVERFRDFKQGEGEQVEMAKIAIANGEWLGNGPGNSTMRNFIFASYNDFVYAIIMEEYGLLGALVILILYIYLFFRATALVTKSQKSFGAMAVVGLSLMLVLQALFNMAVSLNLVPVTGLPLPLISMGGTSTLFTCISFGIILSISKYIERADAKKAAVLADPDTAS